MTASTSSKPKRGFFLSTEYNAEGHRLDFMFNPTTITERRSSDFHLSEAQGQSLPIAQFGQLGVTEIEFQLFMYNLRGLGTQLRSLRRLCLPKKVSKLTYYDQASPHRYTLDLSNYGVFTGVVSSVEIKTQAYHKITMEPTRLTADVVFKVVSASLSYDVTHLRTIGGY